MVANFEAIDNDIPIDYEHLSYEPGVAAKASGWIKKLYDLGERGLWADVEWTVAAKDMIAEKEYRYLSPAIVFNYKDPSSGKNVGAFLDSVGLTNRPYLDGMQPLTNKKPDGEGEQMKDVLKKLGLGEQASEADAVAAIAVLQASAEKFVALAKSANLDEKTFTLEAFKAAFVPPKKEDEGVPKEMYVTLKAQVESQAAELKVMKLAAFLTKGEQAGKIVPANRADWEKRFNEKGEAYAEDLLGLAPVLLSKEDFTKKLGDPKATSEPETDEHKEVKRLLYGE